MLNFRLPLLFALAIVVSAVARAAPPGAAPGTPPPANSGDCGTPPTSHAFLEPPDIDIGKLPRDANGDPEIVLAVHRDGDRFCYQYRFNGRVRTMQPTLRVRRGERFDVRIVNDIRAPGLGQTAQSNQIPPCKPMAMPEMQPVERLGYLNHVAYDRAMLMKPYDTNIHFHGFEGPAEEENVFLSTLSTPMHACEYRITVPRTQPPGTYFYHAHAHGMSEAEVFGGLSGMWIVEPDTPQLPRSDEHVIEIRDLVPKVDDDTSLPNRLPIIIAASRHQAMAPPMPAVAYDPFNPPAWPSSLPMKAGLASFNPNGCDGNVAAPLVSINGVAAAVTLDVAAGRTQLLRMLNATTDSIKRIRLRDEHGRNVPLEIVARDGIPISGDSRHPLSAYVASTSIVIPPAGRADALLTIEPGQQRTLYSDHMCQGPIGEYVLPHDLVVIRPIPDTQGVPPRVASKPVRSDPRVDALLTYARSHPHEIHRRAITFTAYSFAPAANMPLHPALYITDTTKPDFQEHPFWPSFAPNGTAPENADIVVKKGSIEEWYLFNATLDSHAFHIHQMAFAEESDPSGVPVMLDTVWVPSGSLLPNPADPLYPLVKPALVKVLLDFRHVRRGTFVFHCHMLFHEDHGMMGIIRVV